MTYGIPPNPDQRWLSEPDLQVHEALLIKRGDSDPGVVPFAPHAPAAGMATKGHLVRVSLTRARVVSRARNFVQDRSCADLIW